MMDIKDARKVINDLENKPFLCSDTEIQTESGYIITRKEVKKMEIRKGQKVKVICTEARLKEVGVKQKHIKHILGKIGTVKEVRTLPDMDIPAYFVHFRYINLKAAPGNRKPYYVFLEDMIEPLKLEVIEGNKKDE